MMTNFRVVITLPVFLASMAIAEIADAHLQGDVHQTGAARRTERALVIRKVGAKENIPSMTLAISPDGKRAAYITTNEGLGIRDLATGKSRVIVESDTASGHPFDPVFSPDGKSIAYEMLMDRSFSDMYVINLDGSNRHRLFRRHDIVRYAFPYDWSHNGKYIAAVFRRKDGTYQIVLVNAAVGSSLILKTLEWWSPTRIAFSADDRQIAYDAPQSDEGRQRDIYLLETNGSREDTVVSHAADDFLLGWSPDGKYIVFGSDRGSNTGVWIQEVMEGHPRGTPKLIEPNVGPISSLGITRSGSLYYNVLDQTADVFTATLDWETGKVIVPPARVSKHFVGGNTAPDWSPDGKWIAFVRQPFKVANRASVSVDSRVIVVQSLVTGEERSVSPQLGALDSRNLRWSPDGRSLLIGDRAKNNRTANVIDAVTGEVRSSFGSLAFWSEWSRDGKEVYYAFDDTLIHPAAQLLCARNLGTGAERILNRGAIGPGFAISPDGKQVAFSDCRLESNTAGNLQPVSLKIILSTGGDARTILVLDSPECIGAISWSVDGASLLFEKDPRGTGKAELWRIPAKGGEPRRVGLGMTSMAQFSVHPDGRRIAYQAGENTNQVWVMENFLSHFTNVRSTGAKRK